MIKVIAFDYGGVIEVQEKGLRQNIANTLNVTVEDWAEVYYSLNHLFNREKQSWVEVATLVAKKFDATDDQIFKIQELIRKNEETRELNLELIEIIKDLKSRNFKIALLSNNSLALRQRLLDQEIIHHFDKVIISAEVGFQKPQPEIFEILLNSLNIKSHELVFIDDSIKSLEGAENIGYTPILFESNEKLMKDLSEIL